jgi:signal transduction histidine kinase
LVVARDVAQRRREEEERAALELRVSEERGALAVNAAELGTWRWDPKRDEIVGSERLRALLDLPAAPRGRLEPAWSTERFLAAIHPIDRPLVQEAIRRCETSDVPIDIEVRGLRADGEAHWVRMHGRCPSSESPVPRVIHGVMSDIEPRKRAEAERLRLLQSLSEAQENEQRRIARELHDQVGQTVTGLSLGLKALEGSLESGAPGDRLREQLRWLQVLTNEIGRDIHRAAADLRPTAIDDLGLEKALAAYVDDWSKRSQIRVDLHAVGQVRRLPLAIETAAYRAVQESLTNVVKHAQATSVSIVLEFRETALRVLVEDDGKGFDPDRIRADGIASADAAGRVRLGITGMRERLAVLGGTLSIETAPDAGTTLFIQIPIPAAG